MCTKYLINIVLFQHLESVIKARLPGIQSLINKSIGDIEKELDYLGRPVAIDAGVESRVSSFWCKFEFKIIT